MKKLGLKEYLAYGIGQAGDTIPYCMFYTCFVFFLTDVVGLSPAVAGAVSLIAVCWDGITDPIVGYLSDRTGDPSGRRRPWMIRSILPLAALIFLMFAPFEIPSKTLAAAYYVIIAALFWTLYTTYVIPHMSLAAEMTESYRERYYDFILMDVQMPHMNGYDATKAIRAIHGPEGVHIPIIAMTANAFEEDRQNALAAGMDEHLAKPIDVQKMFRTIARFL